MRQLLSRVVAVAEAQARETLAALKVGDVRTLLCALLCVVRCALLHLPCSLPRAFCCCACACSPSPHPLSCTPPAQFPYASDGSGGWTITSTPSNWTGGFFTGVLWNLYNLTGERPCQLATVVFEIQA